MSSIRIHNNTESWYFQLLSLEKCGSPATTFGLGTIYSSFTCKHMPTYMAICMVVGYMHNQQ